MTSAMQSGTQLQPGTWEGEYLDVNGYRGKLRLELAVAAAGGLRGTYELTIRSEDKPQVLRGEIGGGIEGERVRLSLALGKTGEPLEYEAQVRPAGAYARQALIGIVHAAPQSNFGGGVWIAWRFARPSATRG